jgi:hypothetical protein
MNTNADPTDKVCKRCNLTKLLNEFSPRKGAKDGHCSHCKECRRNTHRSKCLSYNANRRSKYAHCAEYRGVVQERNRRSGSKFRNKRKEHYREVIRRWRWHVRLAVIVRYGGECKCCQETIPHFLSIDHVDGKGYLNRRGRSSDLYRVLFKTEAILPEYRLLCFNCNFTLGQWGYCPHNKVGPQPSLLDKRRSRELGVQHPQGRLESDLPSPR